MGSTQRFFPSNSVEEVFINFPDPWPKKKHAKYGLVKPEFLDELHRILKRGGTVALVTDDPAYSKETIDTFRQQHPEVTNLDIRQALSIAKEEAGTKTAPIAVSLTLALVMLGLFALFLVGRHPDESSRMLMWTVAIALGIAIIAAVIILKNR